MEPAKRRNTPTGYCALRVNGADKSYDAKNASLRDLMN